MKRRWPKEFWYADGRMTDAIAALWVSRAKRRTHKRERREGRAQSRKE